MERPIPVLTFLLFAGMTLGCASLVSRRKSLKTSARWFPANGRTPLQVKASGWHTYTHFCASSDLTMPFAINSCIALHPRFSQQGSSTLARLSCWCRHSIRQSHNARTSRRSELRFAQGRLRRSLTRWIRSVDPVCIWPGAMATSISERWCCQARPSSLLKSPVQCFDEELEANLTHGMAFRLGIHIIRRTGGTTL